MATTKSIIETTETARKLGEARATRMAAIARLRAARKELAAALKS